MSEASERAEQIVANMLLMDVDHAKHLPRFQDALKVFRAAIEQAVRAERERGNRLEAAMRKIEALQSHCECWDISGVALRAEAAIRERAGGHPA
jgi:hypothetical protein